MEVVNLPEPKRTGSMSLEEAISKRRSERAFSTQKLSMEQIGQLCWAAQGTTDKRSGFRSAPSAGALYPLELFAATEEGVYRYITDGHKLETVVKKDRRRELAKAALNQDWFEDAPVIFVVAGVYRRTTAKYGPRGKRYVDMEAGYAAENIHLQAVALGLGSTSVGAFSDDDIGRLINAKAEEAPLLLVPVGYVK